MRQARARWIVAAYLALGACWAGISRTLVPPIIAAAYQGRGPEVLNRFFRGRTPHPLEHYLGLWDTFAGAVLIAWLLHLAVVLVVGRLAIEPRLAGRLVPMAGGFLALTVLSGPRHDYVADLEIWDAIQAGSDPWYLLPGKGYPLNAYGPLFNPLAGLAWLNPMGPKLLFASAYLGFVIWIVADFGGGRTAWLLNPFPWVEIAWFGHFDILVAVACVAAVHARVRGRDLASGAILAAGILLKYLPLVILPFLALNGRRTTPRLVLIAAGVVALGLAASVGVWGFSTFRPLTFAATRGSVLLSVFRFLRGAVSPLLVFQNEPNIDFLALPCLLLAGGSMFAWCWWRKVEPATSALLAVLTTLLFYRVGFIQYQMVPFVLGWYWWATVRPASERSRFAAGAMVGYFAALGAFDLYYAWLGGVIHPWDSWAWIEEVVGLPGFLAGLVLIIALLRHPSGRGRPVSL